MRDFIDFTQYEDSSSKFIAELSDRGGYITFSNSGKGGDKKFFTLGLDSFITCLKNIRSNLDKFSAVESYVEKPWRDLGATYFTDPAAKAQITVQTKPVITTLSKIIMWSNSPVLDATDPEKAIDLKEEYVAAAIEKLERLSLKYKPTFSDGEKSLVKLNSTSLRDFSLSIFKYFFSDHWEELFSEARAKKGRIGSVDFSSLDYGPFVRLIGKFNSEQSNESLTSAGTLRYFAEPIFINSEGHYYFTSQWNGAGDYPLSFDNLKVFFENKYSGYRLEEKDGSYLLIREVKEVVPLLEGMLPLPKPFLLLAGISGTGKTRFVREQARASNPTGDNYCLVPVRPDWHEPSDLLGYISRLSGQAEYVTTDVLTFIVKAWRAAAPAAGKEGLGEVDHTCIPYWLCLDEMNLAPVEQYFADYLSVLESREFSVSGYRCEALLNSDTLKRLIETDPKLPTNLGLDAGGDLWQYFLHHGISLPPNLIVAGTVNMDETTHGFSRKVIDRAITLDFGEFFPNDYADFFEPKSQPVSFTWSPISHGSKDALVGTVDEGGAKSIAFLESINKILKRTPFELAYRALNELLLQVVCLQPASVTELQALWDDFLMTKVLPRIDGDEDKLRSVGGAEGTILDQLEVTLEDCLELIWDAPRKDYFRVTAGTTEAVESDCRSRTKLAWMKDRLEVNTFTSYWP